MREPKYAKLARAEALLEIAVPLLEDVPSAILNITVAEDRLRLPFL